MVRGPELRPKKDKHLPIPFLEASFTVNETRLFDFLHDVLWFVTLNMAALQGMCYGVVKRVDRPVNDVVSSAVN